MSLIRQWTEFPRGVPPVLGRVAVECTGRSYGSWIAGRGHSAGDLIEELPSIIESILRDELGVATANIDTASFDNTGVSAGFSDMKGQLFVNSDVRISSMELLNMLAFQGLLLLVVSAGKWRVIELQANDHTINATIDYSEVLKAPWVRYVDSHRIVNHLTVNFQYAPQYNAFQKSSIFQDSTSQSTHGVRKATIDCPHLDNSSITTLENLLITSGSDALWSRPRLLVDIETIGWKYAHLEVGDTIALDATSFDPHLLRDTGSWGDNNKRLLILRKVITGASVNFETVRLFVV